MLKFSEILFEAREKKSSKKDDWNPNDAKGKLFEILTGSHLHHGTAKDGTPNGFLQHYRDEEGKSPKDVHDYIKSEMQRRDPGAYEEVAKHAREASQNIRDQLAAHGHTKIHETAWTSQKGDHKRFTDVDDPASDADLMVRTENGPVGLSLKYGETKNMNLRNPGLETLENAAGLAPNELDELRRNHSNYTKSLGIRNHAHYKEMAKNPAYKHIIDAAMESANKTQKAIAGKVANGLALKSKEDPEYLRNYIKNTISPETKFQHFRLHARPDGKGNATHHMSDMQDDSSKLDNYEDLRVAPHEGNTITYRIEGRRKGLDAKGNQHPHETVFTQNIRRGGSGPMKGFMGGTTAPFLTKSDEAEGSLTQPTARSTRQTSVSRAATKPKVKQTPVQDEDERIAAMSNEGGREPPERSLGGTHGGPNFYSPVEEKQIRGSFNA
jgi:hypothetical protein